MGSGNDNRKNSDTTIVRRPKNFGDFGYSSSTGSKNYADVCIPSFDVLIKDTNIAQSGIKVHLKKESDTYLITIAGTVIGTLSGKYSKMITKCMEFGIKYSGEIFLIKSKKYARFIRLL